MTNILIADDEKEIIKLLRIYLEKDGVTVFEAYDGEMAYLILKNYPIDLAIVDINMPWMNGYELIQKVRTTMDIPIMVISAKVELSDRVLGLDLGADDYITKPFEPLEVAAKVKARLRRMSPDPLRDEVPFTTVGDLTLNVSECRLDRNGEAVELTKVEFLVLKMFMESPGRVFTKEQVYENGWGSENAVDDNTIRVIISRLRDKIGEDKITTIRGLGYRLEKNG
ncbi:MAG: response regulator transcription factor [Clostridiales bacterium]|nr:response regulator transcription factor [Clostridiales bacterium]